MATRRTNPQREPHQETPLRTRSLSETQIRRLHESSLEILSRTGMRFHSEEALSIMRRGGAEVTDGNLVRIPARLVAWAVRAAPKEFTIYDRTGRPAMILGGFRSYFGPGSDAAHIWDPLTRERRKAVLADVVRAARLVQALPNMDFAMSQFLPSDVPTERYERIQMATMLRETTKPVVFVGLERSSTVWALEMAAAVAGGPENLTRTPFVINYVNFTSPFVHNEESLERLLYAAERNLPSVYTPGRARGSQVPMTEAGAIAVVNAGQLAGLVLAQLRHEGSPFLWAAPYGAGLDMATLVGVYSAPDAGPYAWDLAHRYGIPTFGFAGFADAKLFDTQAAGEVALTLFENAMHGANLVHDLGLLDSGMTGSLELLAFCDEIVGWLRRYLQPIEVNDETLALEVVRAVGPDGTFLDSDHTLRHVRETWHPALFDRRTYLRWSEDGSLTAEERAARLVNRLTAERMAPPLDPATDARLERVIEA